MGYIPVPLLIPQQIFEGLLHGYWFLWNELIAGFVHRPKLAAETGLAYALSV